MGAIRLKGLVRVLSSCSLKENSIKSCLGFDGQSGGAMYGKISNFSFWIF